MRREEQKKHFHVQSAAQPIVAGKGINEGAHEQSSAKKRGDKHNNRTTYNNDYCDGYNKQHSTSYYRGDRDYGYYNSNGDYTDIYLDYNGYDICGYYNYEANYI